MLTDNVIKERVCNVNSCAAIQRYKQRVLAKSVDNSHNTCKSQTIRQISNKVNMYNFPWLIRYWNLLLKSILFICVCLLTTARLTLTTVLYNEVRHTLKIEVFAYHFQRTLNTKMTSAIMIFL